MQRRKNYAIRTLNTALILITSSRLVPVYLFMFQSFVVVGAMKGEFDKKEVHDFVIRNDLTNFFAKAMKGDSVKVAYFGESITAQNG